MLFSKQKKINGYGVMKEKKEERLKAYVTDKT